MKKADGPSWQIILAIIAVIFLVVLIAFIIVTQSNLIEGGEIIKNLLS